MNSIIYFLPLLAIWKIYFDQEMQTQAEGAYLCAGGGWAKDKAILIFCSNILIENSKEDFQPPPRGRAPSPEYATVQLSRSSDIFQIFLSAIFCYLGPEFEFGKHCNYSGYFA